ncbi:hypothetical protein SAMN02745244_02694 [Tessaracoccus bendigoensis DSM 12906]|uniref:Uncharacterized protein n=1 Tax=Tessaracoccus bendigoensis DSM 12906 TaxID=1123357 RepID=A0A1M6JZK9_9ACTN|nr:hypothetical protein [Tessaracoccus bendigoensis]SHJ52149.1 hypothetical protein SAMN02745244_02694 [Tessaracoccus bendigoensis DSM 12906]
MPALTWFLIVVAVGVALLAAAVVADRHARRRVSGLGQPAPLRHSEEVNRHVPTYITQDEVDALPAPNRAATGSLPRRGEGFSFGHAHRDFANVAEGVSRDNVTLLIVDGTVSSMRELLAPLSAATTADPLVIVAAGFHPDVLTTLAANRRVLQAPVAAAVADARERLRLAELTGASQLSVADLQAGYVPSTVLGLALHWSSTSTRAWVQASDGSQPRSEPPAR